MKPSKLLITIALVPFGCAQPPQSAPPPAPAATVAPPVLAAVETPTTPSPSAGPISEPSVAPGAAKTTTTSTAPPASKPPAASKPTTAPSVAAVPATGVSGAEKAAQATGATGATVVPAAPATPAPRVRLIVPAGTLLPIEIATTLSSATSKDGDPVLAVLSEDVVLDGFKLDKGAEVRGHVQAAVAAKRVKGQARLVVVFDTVTKNSETLVVHIEPIDTLAASTRDKDKKVIAGGAVGGLILGAIKDGKKGAAVGTVIGAAAGTGAVLIMKGDEVEIPRGAKLTLTVTK